MVKICTKEKKIIYNNELSWQRGYASFMILSCLFAAKRRTNNAVTSHSSQAKLHFLVWFVGKLLPGENIRMPENIENVG